MELLIAVCLVIIVLRLCPGILIDLFWTAITILCVGVFILVVTLACYTGYWAYLIPLFYVYGLIKLLWDYALRKIWKKITRKYAKIDSREIVRCVDSDYVGM